MSQFPLARIRDFLAQVVPFDSLAEAELNRVVSRMELAYYPRAQVIIQAGGAPSKHLFIIHSGSVKITAPAPDGAEILVDIRGEGDMFGALSLLYGRHALFTVTAQEDVLAFLLPGEEFRPLVADYPEFQRHFSYSLARNFQAVQQTVDSRLGRMTGTESFKHLATQMRNRVADLMSASILTTAPGTTVRDAAGEMTRRRVGSIIIVDQAGRPLGVLTDTDLRARVLAPGLDPQIPVNQVMTSPALTISHQAFAFEAMLDMTRRGVHHLLVMEADRLVGVISDHDIKVLTGSTPVGLVREIDNITSQEEMSRLPIRIQRVLEMLLRLGSSAEYMMDLITEFIDRVTLKLCRMAEQEMSDEGRGPVPGPYCWLTLGQAGRREQAPPTIQDYALVFVDLPRESDEAAKTWLMEFGRRVGQGLIACGLQPRRPGRETLGTDWCQNASAWGNSFRSMIRETAAGADLGLLLDFRPVHGQFCPDLVLRNNVSTAIGENPAFLKRLTETALRQPPPLGFLRQFLVEKNGAYAEYLNLDSRVLGPIVDAARVMALDMGVNETNTLGRLAELARMDVLNEKEAADLREAFSLATSMRISRYLEAQEENLEHLDHVPAREMNNIQRKMLKDSFAVINRVQKLLAERYLDRARG